MVGERRIRWTIAPELRGRMFEVARRLRAESTEGEAALWEALRSRRLLERRFRRQQPVGPFVLDFYCAEERLAVEVDSRVHDQQEETDAERQALIETLGIRFVGIPDDLVRPHLRAALRLITNEFTDGPNEHALPLHVLERGRGVR